MTDYDYDLIVIGAGSGGLAASKRATSLGAKVLICDDDRTGGTCVIRGCVPKKVMTYGAQILRAAEVAKYYGTKGELTGDFAKLAEHRNRIVDRLEGIHQKNLEKAGVEYRAGRGRLVSEHEVDIGGQTYRAKYILVATGSRPRPLEIPGAEHLEYSDHIFEWDKLPKRIALIGGGFIGCEMASIFRAYGSEVTLLTRSRLLASYDADIADHLQSELRRQGVVVEGTCSTDSIEKLGNELKLHCSITGEQKSWTFDKIVNTTGRIPNTQNIGLDELGVDFGESHSIDVNETHQSSISSIYAIGDVTGRAMLTPVAIKAGRTLAMHLFSDGDGRMDYNTIPSAVFSNPQVSAVGLSEEEARAQFGDDLLIYGEKFVPMYYSGFDEHQKQRSRMKMMVQKSSGRVLGLHMCGDDAAEIIQGFAVALKMGATKKDFDNTVAIHPSAAEEWVLMS